MPHASRNAHPPWPSASPTAPGAGSTFSPCQDRSVIDGVTTEFWARGVYASHTPASQNRYHPRAAVCGHEGGAPMDLVNPVVQRVCREAAENPERFWDRAARDLFWFRTWDQVLDWQPPTFKWFVGGRTNLAYNCIDRHVEAGRGGQAA